MQPNPIALDITDEKTRFKQHIEINDNKYILFSGIYGIGKTYFLQEFFKEYEPWYETFYISPVNYSVSSNQDIFEYIKYDIAFNLLGKDVPFEDYDFSKIFTVQSFCMNNADQIIAALFKNAGKIGKDFEAVYQSLLNLKTQYDTYHSKITKREPDVLKAFLSELSQKEGSIFEENLITQLVSGLIQRLPEDKKKVLVIDDFDRIDPEHIFRILNVFASHLNYQNSGDNKFGFDRIIIVCDIDNIRNIFHARYGSSVDFSGYIDKFYSHEVYYYNNKQVIRDSIMSILRSIEVDERYQSVINLKNPNHVMTHLLAFMIEHFINTDSINLRALLKYSNSGYNIKTYFTNSNHPSLHRIRNWQFPIVLALDILLDILGGVPSQLLIGIERCSKAYPTTKLNNDIKWHLNMLLPLLNGHSSVICNGNTFEYSHDNYIYQYNIKGRDSHDIFWGELISIKKDQIDMTDVQYFQLLKMAYPIYLNLRN